MVHVWNFGAFQTFLSQTYEQFLPKQPKTMLYIYVARYEEAVVSGDGTTRVTV